MTESDKNFITRQATFLFNRGMDANAIQTQLTEKLGVQYQYSDEDTKRSRDKFREPVIRRLIDTAETMGCRLTDIVLAADRLKHDAAVISQPARRIFAGVISYLVAVSVVMLILIMIFSNSIAPTFTDLFSTFSTELPYLTTLVFGTVMKTILILFPLLVIFLTVMLSKTAKGLHQLRSDAATWMLYIPVLSRLIRQHCSWLYVEVVAVMRDLVGNHEELMEKSKAIAFSDNKDLLKGEESSIDYISKCLKGAQTLDNLEQEIEFWRSKLDTDHSIGVALARERLILVATVIMGVLIGIVVVATYLPVFKMGAVI